MAEVTKMERFIFHGMRPGGAMPLLAVLERVEGDQDAGTLDWEAVDGSRLGLFSKRGATKGMRPGRIYEVEVTYPTDEGRARYGLRAAKLLGVASNAAALEALHHAAKAADDKARHDARVSPFKDSLEPLRAAYVTLRTSQARTAFELAVLAVIRGR